MAPPAASMTTPNAPPRPAMGPTFCLAGVADAVVVVVVMTTDEMMLGALMAHSVPQHVRLFRPQQYVPSVHDVISAKPEGVPPACLPTQTPTHVGLFHVLSVQNPRRTTPELKQSPVDVHRSRASSSPWSWQQLEWMPDCVMPRLLHGNTSELLATVCPSGA